MQQAPTGLRAGQRPARRERARREALAGSILWPTDEHPLQGRVQGGKMDWFRHQPCRRRGGLDVGDGRCVRMGTHVDDRNRRGDLDAARGLNAVHGPLQPDVHEHEIRAVGEGVRNRLRASPGQGDDLIAEAAELPGDV